MSNTTPVAVPAKITTVLDTLLPFVPALAQKIPGKVRVALWALLPVLAAVLSTIPAIPGTPSWTIPVATLVVGALIQIGNTDITPKG